MRSDIVIIGAGAAGLMAAYFCSLNGKKVYLLDHNKQIGRKILISGGGRCNFTNMYSEPTDFYSDNPHFCKSALSRFSPWDFIAMVEEQKIEYFEKKLGQLFCKHSAKDIIKLLQDQLQKPNIEILLEEKDLEVEESIEGFRIYNNRISIEAPSLILATGGLSLPSIGASDFGHKLAKRFGHKIIPTTPVLVPFKVSGFDDLKGNAFVAGITCNGHYVAEEVLFTHKGLSGPCILKISLFWNHGDEIEINWLPEKSVLELLLKSAGNIPASKVLKKYLPNNFVDLLFERISIELKTNIADLSKDKLTKIEQEFHHMKITPEGTEGFRKAEATRGGVATDKVSSKTMESQLKPGLFFIGEVLDVTGQLGGHNFQWAWASAHAAGKALA